MYTKLNTIVYNEGSILIFHLAHVKFFFRASKREKNLAFQALRVQLPRDAGKTEDNSGREFGEKRPLASAKMTIS